MPSDDEARNLAPRNRSFWAYLGLVTALGLGLAGSALLHLRADDFDLMGAAFYVAAGLLVLLELRPLVTAGSPDANGVSTSTAFVFALLLHWGLAPALLMMTIATILADVVRRKAPWRTAFNVGQFAVSYAASSVTLAVLGLHPSPQSPVGATGGRLAPLSLAWAVYFGGNAGSVAPAPAWPPRPFVPAGCYDTFGGRGAAAGALTKGRSTRLISSHVS